MIVNNIFNDRNTTNTIQRDTLSDLSTQIPDADLSAKMQYV